MMGSFIARRGTQGLLRVCIVAVALAASAAQSQGQVITLSDLNSVAQIDTGSSAGMFNWLVNGHDQLAQQWFWYRVGSTGQERPINTISSPVNSQPNARTLSTTYNNGAIMVEVLYVLTGGNVGSGHSDIGESIRITNLGTTPMDLHFFQYSDFDLEGGPNTIQLGTDLQGRFNEALQTTPIATFSESISVVAPGANHGEAALFPFTLNRLNDGLATQLNDNMTAGPGDCTWGFEWDVTIAPGGTFLISKDKYIDIVPAPSSAAFISIGLAGMARRRRRAAV